MIHPAWERELMWAAGFFDGEGHCRCHRGLRIMISQRRREPLERFLRAFAVGKIMETSKDGRPLYHYYPQNAADTRYVAELLLTRVSEVKREQISAALERYDAERSEPRKKPGRKPGSPGRKWTEVEKRHLSEVQANIRRKVA